MNIYAQQALTECNSEKTAAHLGGVNGRPFWNAHSTQFIFVPAFDFPKISGAKEYLFIAEDVNGVKHTFKATEPTHSLEPIWSELPVGVVHLEVKSLNSEGQVEHIAGARSFYKCKPFPGRDAYPPKCCCYRECALSAYRYIFNDEKTQYWLKHGKPMPDYAHNVYPSKTIDAIVRAMVSYAKFEPEHKREALDIACRAADYLISISFDNDCAMAGLPPTYSFENLNAEAVNKVAPAAQSYVGRVMMIYPITAAIAYLTLCEATNNIKYFNAALRIANYYKTNILPCGSWYLLYDSTTGKPICDNICISFAIVNFFRMLYEKTNNNEWKEISNAHYQYIISTCLKDYKWEGQFEDVGATLPYHNLSHFIPDDLIDYIAKYKSDDPQMVEEAVDLMRFVEDQFVVWGEHPKWNITWGPEPWYYPAGLEQYNCYVPIDASAALILTAFVNMYKLKGDKLYLEKAMTLADAITRTQNRENGCIPTFWMGENCAYGYENFWINCLLYSAEAMMNIADLTESLDIE